MWRMGIRQREPFTDSELAARDLLLTLLNRHGTALKTAKATGVALRTLQRRIQRYGIEQTGWRVKR